MEKKLAINATEFQDLYIIEPNAFIDDRGMFSRVFCEDELKDIFKFHIMQINHSTTTQKGSVRGLHFQYEPNAEIKMVKCIKGSIFDVVVDIRKGSPTFLKHFSIELSSKNRKMLYVPKGFAHGFQSLEDNIEIFYLSSSLYSPNQEAGLNIADPILNIQLPCEITDISLKDKNHDFLTDKFIGIEVGNL